ncbi:hypothetical protein, partial [Acidisoma sp. L85]|uniref:hypothetical protein n=1 Tax=Acidisoma sp. L85 TaxID=1641850 RepID=UPI001C207FAD
MTSRSPRFAFSAGSQDRGGDERRRRPLSRQQSRGLPPTTSFVKHGRIPARHEYPLPSLDIQHNPHVERGNGWRLESI